MSRVLPKYGVRDVGIETAIRVGLYRIEQGAAIGSQDEGEPM